jgi:hypothetical protein
MLENSSVSGATDAGQRVLKRGHLALERAHLILQRGDRRLVSRGSSLAGSTLGAGGPAPAELNRSISVRAALSNAIT